MKHKDKIKLANKMLTPIERINGVSKFSSKAWMKRHDAIQLKINKKRNEAKT